MAKLGIEEFISLNFYTRHELTILSVDAQEPFILTEKFIVTR